MDFPGFSMIGTHSGYPGWIGRWPLGRSAENQETDPRKRRGRHTTQKHVRNDGSDVPVTFYGDWRPIV